MSGTNNNAAGNGAGPASAPENVDFDMLEDPLPPLSPLLDYNYENMEVNAYETLPMTDQNILGIAELPAADNSIFGFSPNPFGQSFPTEQEIFPASHFETTNFLETLPPVPKPIVPPQETEKESENNEVSGFDVNSFLNPEFRPGNVQHKRRRISNVPGPFPEPTTEPNREIIQNPHEPRPLPNRIPLPYPNHSVSIPGPHPQQPQPLPAPHPEPHPEQPQPLREPETVHINPSYVVPYVPGPVLPDHILTAQHPTIPWLKVPRELTIPGVNTFNAMPIPKQKAGDKVKHLTIEEKYFSASLPYCNLIPADYSLAGGIDARNKAVPWRIPATVPSAELRRAIEIMMPIYRRGILDLSIREAYKITHELFSTYISQEDKAVVLKWCLIPVNRKGVDHQARDVEMRELQILFGLTKEAKANITRELRTTYRNTYNRYIARLRKFPYPAWTTEEVGKIWKVYIADRTNEGMYDTMYAALKKKRNHRSIMRMLEFVVYCEKNPGIANPNMRDAFTTSPIPDAVAPDNPMTDGEMKTFLELRAYYGPMNDWIALIDHMNEHADKFGHRKRQVADVKELYIRQGLDYLSEYQWTPPMDSQLQFLVNIHSDNWNRIANIMNRTPHAIMARSNYLNNHPDWCGKTRKWTSLDGKGPSRPGTWPASAEAEPSNT